MAIQVQTVGATDLRLAANITKAVNWNNPRSGGVLDGLTVGHWRGLMLRMPGTATGNADYAILGVDAAGGTPTGNFTGSSDTILRIGGNTASRGASQMRPFLRSRSSTTDAFAGTGGAEGIAATLPQFASNVGTLLLWGINHLEHLGVPGWYGWFATCRLDTGAVSSHVAPTPIAASWIAATNVNLFRQLFAAFGTSIARTPAGFAAEQLAMAQGDFPWDTANDANVAGVGRPHHDAIAALAGFGGHPPLTYAELAAAQATGTLPYPNCVQGRSLVEHHWTLRSLATGLANTGSAGAASLVQTDWNGLTGGLVDGADIAPAHWYGGAPTIANPAIKFTGGRGGRATVASGGRGSGQGVQRRWEEQASGTALAGLDWADVAAQGATGWMSSDMLPVGGPYRLRVRDAATVALASSSDDWLVGTVILTHGQSGMERAFMQGAVPGGNTLGIAVAGGAQGLMLKLNNQEGGTAAAYVQPVPVTVRMRGGETPALGHGAVLMLNEWNSHNPGHPLLICNMAINGTVQADWVNNSTINGGHDSWRFLGTIGAVAGAGSGNGSGVVEAYAALLGRFVDAHMFMWTPNISTDAAVRSAYVAAIDARFSQASGAPWIVLPVWRAHRDLPDGVVTVATRQAHLDFQAQLAGRGVLGPCWIDIVQDSSGSGHSAFGSAPGVPNALLPVSDGNQVGQARLGRGLGRVAAWQWDRGIKAHGPRVLAAWYGDAGRTRIEVELGRQVRTLNGAAVSNRFWISTDNGASFTQGGFAVALSPDGSRAVLTSSGAPFPAADVRVDYARAFPAAPAETPDEAGSERVLDGLLYDDQTHRGAVNFAAGARAGNVLQGSNRNGAGVAGVAVQARGPARLVATERWTGSRTVLLRLMAADGVTVLRERSLVVTGS